MPPNRGHDSGSALVSIITPAFNAEGTLEDTVASVQAQSHAHWEMLIADDGSTDGTAALAERLAADDARIRVLRVEGETGLPARARNVAMAAAQGEYLAFLDADDRWSPEKLARQVAWLEAHPEAGGVCCWFDTFGDPARVASERFRMHAGSTCRRAEAITGMPFFTLTLMIRREVYEEMGGMDEDPRLFCGEDTEYFLRLVSNYRIDRIREVLAHYRLAPAAAPSISQAALSTDNAKGWKLTEVMVEKGLLTPREIRMRRSHLHYEQARHNLHHFQRPFRRELVRAVMAGAPSWQAVVTLALCFLPRPVLAKLLNALLDGLHRFQEGRLRAS
jgi:glycosyltransferase involved in cell wall biosynthesis